MQAIDNSGIKGYNANFAYPGFTPSMSYTYDTTLKVVVCDTDNLVLPAAGGASGKFHANIQVHDEYGNTAYGHIGPLANPGTASAAIDVSGLDNNKGLNITATIVANIGYSATGSAFDITGGPTAAMPTGHLRDWNIADAPASADESLIQ